MRASTTYNLYINSIIAVVIPSQNEGFYNNLGGWNVTNVVVIPSQNEGFYNAVTITTSNSDK